jgi:hypothetical protein
MHGNGVLKERDLIIMPALCASETYAFEFDFQTQLSPDFAVIQFVLEWTECEAGSHRRMVRLFSIGFPISPEPAEVLSGVDEGALTAILVKRILQNMIGFGTPEAEARFQSDSRVFANFKAIPQFAYGVLHRDFLRNAEPTQTEAKLARMMQLRSATVIDILLYCYPRIISVDDGNLKLLCKASFGEALLVIHTIDAVFVWAPNEQMLLEEVGGAASSQGVIDLDLLEGQKADQIRMIVRGEWELSCSYVIVLPIFGEEPIKKYCVEENRGDVSAFSIWTTQGRFVPPA